MQSCIRRLKKGDIVRYHVRGGNPEYESSFIFDHFYNLGYTYPIRYILGKMSSNKQDTLYDLTGMAVIKIIKSK